MSKKAWIIFGAVCVALLAVLVYASSKNKLDVSSIDASHVISASEKSGDIADHVFGKADSKVVFVEYGDFQCPSCGNAHPMVKEITEKYKDHLAFVFRNFPLTSKHPNAKAAASAAEASGLQGKYWEMHNRIFETQSAWSNLTANERTDFFAGYADELGLNVEKFKTDMTNENISQKINFDLAVGKHNKVDATPTFMLNGQKMTGIDSDQGGFDPEKFEGVIRAKLEDSGVKLPKE